MIFDKVNVWNCIFEVVKIIKYEIKECKGILMRFFDVSDLNEDIVRRFVLNNLYWLFWLIIGFMLDIEDMSMIDDKKVLSIV